MKFDWKNWNLGGKIIFVAACVATVSMLMKWVDIGFASQSGLSQEAFLFLGLWIYPVIMLFKNKNIQRIWGLVCSICSVVFTLGYISSKTIEIFAEKIKNSKTILWNGPLGIFEIEPFNKGTYSLAKKVAKLTKENKMESIAGGGDTISAIIKAGVAKSFTYTSLAGGAFLEWLEGKELPGIKALRINKKMI